MKGPQYTRFGYSPDLLNLELGQLTYGVPRTIAQGGVPIYVAPDGSMAANGALTLSVALGATEPNAWLYFPAGAVASGSAEGFYFTKMSSTTLGTVYAETYTPGTTSPSVPETNTAISDAGPGAYTGVTAEVIAVSVTLPANSMGPNGRLTNSVTFDGSTGAGIKTFKTKFGGQLVYTTAVTTTTTALSRLTTIQNSGVTNRQTIPANRIDIGTGNARIAPIAIDTTAAVVLSITLQTSAGATDWAGLLAWAFELRYEA